jgi:PAS domain S-box-containing protein
MQLLLIDDDIVVRSTIEEQLESRGTSVTTAADVATALAALRGASFDIVILDLTLPDGSGLDVLTALREQGSSAHVIVLSGAATEADRVRALEVGADDYVVKPFYAAELAARVFAVARRRQPRADSVLTFGPLMVDLGVREVTVNDSLVDLADKEFDLLAFLATRPGHVFSRGELFRLVWHSMPHPRAAANVTEHVRRLRSKIEPDPAHPRSLVTVRGAGFRFDPPASTAADPMRRIEELTEVPCVGTLVHVGGRVVSADGAAVGLLGRADEAELLGSELLALVAPPSKDAARVRMASAAAGHSQRSQIVEFQRPDGDSILVELTSTTTEWGGQCARRVVMTPVVDLSSKLRGFVTGVFSDLSDVVIVTDLGAHIRSWNVAAERLYGWSEHEVLGRHIIDVVARIDDDAALASTWLDLAETGRWYGDCRHRTRDGRAVTVASSITLVRDDNDEPIGIVAVNRPASSRPTPVATLARGRRDESEIRRAIDEDEFEVHYQPVVELEDHSVVSVEALVRWNHPERGLLSPGAFIDAAERTGLILELGASVLDRACRQCAEWRAGGVDIDLAVNLSTKELADPALFDRVAATLDASKLDPCALWLEVTETSLVEDVDQASAALHRLVGLGIRTAIDDFGTGWASLTYLRQFPVHALKIDRTFVSGIDRNTSDVAIARSIVMLGAELGLAVVAEGIETATQERVLRVLGCQMGQGYLYGRPTPAHAVPLDLSRTA